MAQPHIVLVTQEIRPFVQGGGIGRHVRDLAELLGARAHVTVLTSSRWQQQHDALRAAGDPELPAGVRFEFFEEPGEDIAPFTSVFHASSAACCAALRRIARDGVDLVEFEDYRALGAVATDAMRAGVPELADTTLAVRMHTSWEMTAVIDGVPVDAEAAYWLAALERLALRSADVVIAPAPETLTAYRRFYGRENLAPAITLPPALHFPAVAVDAEPLPSAADGLRLLFLGRMQEMKGVRQLLRAFKTIDAQDVTLTLVGGDTLSAPGGRSMREHLGRLAGDDPRITFRERVDPSEIPRLVAGHHVVVTPSRFEAFGYVVREALAANRPAIVTPVGGLVGSVVEGRTGWVTAGTSIEDIAETLRRVSADRIGIDEIIAAGAPRAAIDDAMSEPYVERRLSLASAPRSRPRPTPDRDRGAVTAIITATAALDLSATVASLRNQVDEQQLELAVVVDDPARLDAAAAAEFSALEVLDDHTSLNAARTRILRARGATGPVVLLDAGSVLEPTFIQRGRHGLRNGDALPYVTAYGSGRARDNVPIGSFASTVVGGRWAAATAILLAPDAVSLPLAEPEWPGGDDAALIAELASLGRYGAVIPERLVGRVRGRKHDQETPRSLTLFGSDGWLFAAATPDAP
jgi:glycosyltransferase involved in cell wall biosynthesis